LWVPAYLAVLAKTGSPGKAAELAHIDSSLARHFKRECPEFAELFRKAKLEFADSLRAEAYARAVEGWLEPVFQQGREVGQVRRKSEQIMLAMLRANCREYRDRVDMRLSIRERAKQIAKAHGLSDEDALELISVAEGIARGEQPA